MIVVIESGVMSSEPDEVKFRWVCERCDKRGAWLSLSEAEQGGDRHKRAAHPESKVARA